MSSPEIELDLVDVISTLGQPPQGVDLETFVIAEAELSDLKAAIRMGTPSYDELERIHDDEPELFQLITETPHPTWKLGDSISRKQEQLSRTRRLVSTALVSLALFSGMGALTYHAKEEIRQDLPALRKDKHDKEYEVLTSAASGVVGAAAGGAIAYMAGLGLAGRLARRPAQKKVRRAEQRAA
jgi:hypothetical protein